MVKCARGRNLAPCLQPVYIPSVKNKIIETCLVELWLNFVISQRADSKTDGSFLITREFTDKPEPNTDVEAQWKM